MIGLDSMEVGTVETVNETPRVRDVSLVFVLVRVNGCPLSLCLVVSLTIRGSEEELLERLIPHLMALKVRSLGGNCS